MASSILSGTSSSGPRRDDGRETDPLIPVEENRGYLCGLDTFISKLRRQYGWKLLVLIWACQQMTTGFVRVLGGKNGATLYLLGDYTTPAATVSMYQSAINTVWSLAPVIGLVSDALPINGYNKAPYVMMTSCLALIASSSLWVVPESSMSVKVAVVCIFVIMLQVVTADACTTGAYTKKVSKRSGLGADLMIYVSMGCEACGFLAGVTSGFVIEDIGAKACYGICALPILVCLVVASLGFYEEEQATVDRTAGIRKLFWEQKEVGGLSILMCIAAIFISFVNVESSNVDVNGALAWTAAMSLLVSLSLLLTPALAKMSVFAILFNAANLNIDAALFYFYTDQEAAFPDGPHFTATFYNSVRAPLWSASGMLGIYLYKRYMKEWPYRKQAVLSNLLFGSALLLDLIIVLRVNLRIGISDHAFFLLATVVHSITYQWQRMPFRVCFLYLCPSHMETTVYALLNGCSDFGGSLGLSLGAVLLSGLQITPDSTVGDASRLKNLPMGIMAAAAGPIVAVLLLQQLIPDASPNEHLVDDAVVGSLLSSLNDRSPAKQQSEGLSASTA
mmetsp:Transcript_168665/g.324234  ORF Transcript_168665/g.324234 Transcript_168665/m.324234 type:complete len:562 (-) Transcript_168665:61-1746(-)